MEQGFGHKFPFKSQPVEGVQELIFISMEIYSWEYCLSNFELV